MKWLSALVALLLPASAWAHPHIWISQHVRVISENGSYVAFELEWHFDPMSSEGEIPAIDEDGDGTFSLREVKALADDMLPELAKVGYQTWLRTGGSDFHPTLPPILNARIDQPATFTPPDWDHDEGDKDAGMPMPENKRVAPPPKPEVPRNLVYIMRFPLAQPVKSLDIVTFDPEDFVRFDVDKASLPPDCTLDKDPTYKSEFVPGKPVFADRVTCRLP
jgi:ABC-type uncharacterized transport system substrate-binding protein